MGRANNIINQINKLDPKKTIAISLVGIYVIAVIIIILITALGSDSNETLTIEGAIKRDPISGEVITMSDTGGEMENPGAMVLGMHQITNYGITTDYMMLMIGYLRDRFNSNTDIISYLRGSFSGDSQSGELIVVVNGRNMYKLAFSGDKIEISDMNQIWVRD